MSEQQRQEQQQQEQQQQKTYTTVMVDDTTYNGLKRLKFHTGGRSFNSLIHQMIDISEQKILEEAREQALVINNTQKEEEDMI